MNLATFQAYLTSKAPLPSSPRNYLKNEETLNGEEAQLLKWAASLPMQLEEQQVNQSEKILTELSVANISDEVRLRLLNIVVTATDRLIATLRKHYIHEIAALNDNHLIIMNQVKSLYYLNVLVCDAVVRRESLRLSHKPQRAPSSSNWKRFMTPTRTPPFTLAVAIFQLLLTYQKLLWEKAIGYQKPPLYIWAALNQLYYLACQYGIDHVDLNSHVVTRQAHTIHQLYCQVCLHSLLNVVAMRRPSILLIQRLLPEWAVHIGATLEPLTETRIFVDLKSNRPPEYLTSLSAINPYEAERDCLFIELEPLAYYLRQQQKVLSALDKKVTEYRLVTNILMAITYRYTERKTTISSKYGAKKRASVVTGFSDIHYRAAGEQRLISMIAARKLEAEYLPRYDTGPKKNAPPSAFEIEMDDDIEATSPFRILRLLTAADIILPLLSVAADSENNSNNSQNDAGQQRSPVQSTNTAEVSISDAVEKNSDSIIPVIPADFLATAPPRLRLMSLFLLSTPQSNAAESLSLGMVRWLTINDSYVEVDGQILGHAPMACALRLDNRDNRSQSFIPALLLAKDDGLQTVSSLVVPSYHFKIEDKVIIRLNDKQHSLRLQRSLLTTEAFTQYEVSRL